MVASDRWRPTEGGHVFRVHKGEIVVPGSDIHSWATCLACGEEDCVDCNPEFPASKCEAPETLPGLGWLET